jgi:hypothetical protein
MPESRAYYHDLREACAAGGCPLCAVADRSAESFINALLWETVTDVDARRRVVASYGFCREHGWRLDRPGGVGGAAIMLADVIKALIAALDEPGAAASGGSMWDRLRGRRSGTEAGEAYLAPAAECPVCEHMRRIEADAAQALLVYLTPGAHTLVEPFNAGNGLCLAHLRLTLAQPGKAQAHAALIVAQRTIWQRLHGELAEFIRKQDVQFRGEPYGSERDSWERALKITSGPPLRKSSASLTQARI